MSMVDLSDRNTSAVGMFDRVRGQMLSETVEYFTVEYRQKTGRVAHGSGYVDKETATGYLTWEGSEDIHEMSAVGLDWMYYSREGVRDIPTPAGEPAAEVEVREVDRDHLETEEESVEEKFGLGESG